MPLSHQHSFTRTQLITEYARNRVIYVDELEEKLSTIPPDHVCNEVAQWLLTPPDGDGSNRLHECCFQGAFQSSSYPHPRELTIPNPPTGQHPNDGVLLQVSLPLFERLVHGFEDAGVSDDTSEEAASSKINKVTGKGSGARWLKDG